MYLGGLLSANGSPSTAVTRRLGEATGSFNKLERVWKHSSLTSKRKLAVYQACVISKLLYGLEVICLRQAERTRIAAFHARCLWLILRIPHSMISRITNAEVLRQADSLPLSEKVQRRQLLMFGRIATLPGEHPLRTAVFEPGQILPKQLTGKRCRGRPRLAWANALFAQAVQTAGGSVQSLNNLLNNNLNSKTLWRSAVNCSRCVA